MQSRNQNEALRGAARDGQGEGVRGISTRFRRPEPMSSNSRARLISVGIRGQSDGKEEKRQSMIDRASPEDARLRLAWGEINGASCRGAGLNSRRELKCRRKVGLGETVVFGPSLTAEIRAAAISAEVSRLGAAKLQSRTCE